ncbi:MULTISPECIES: hypothetical protein [Paraburkholderia]|uniref:hypothetical protein n=1 Tax=Paraburkholderia TaxID=1822464 RepID=UPI0003645029|nr:MULTISPECIES: hypothetical protein [Paraburkholderia]MDH6146332.1 hypothetical protein [Paraburkholderia sp. WSM4179]
MLMIFVHRDTGIFALAYRVGYFRTSRFSEPARRRRCNVVAILEFGAESVAKPVV